MSLGQVLTAQSGPTLYSCHDVGPCDYQKKKMWLLVFSLIFIYLLLLFFEVGGGGGVIRPLGHLATT